MWSEGWTSQTQGLRECQVLVHRCPFLTVSSHKKSPLNKDANPTLKGPNGPTSHTVTLRWGP